MSLITLEAAGSGVHARGIVNFKLESRGHRGGARPGAGRPRTLPTQERQVVEQACTTGRTALPDVVRLWIEGLTHKCQDPKHDDHDYRLRCAKEIAIRCGMPTLRELKAEIDRTAVPIRVYSFNDPFSEAGIESQAEHEDRQRT